MAWYYSENGQQVGPVDETAFTSLVNAGKITQSTLVWREGMATWLAYSQVGAATAAGVVVSGTQCSECGGAFPEDELVEIGNGKVCAACKPLAVQKLKEGVVTAEAFRFAGFWIRFAAKFVDGLILLAVMVVMNLVVAGVIHPTPGARGRREAAILSVTMMAVGFLIRTCYNILFVGKYGATPGKMACGLRVVRPDGESVSYGRSAGRFFAAALSWLTLTIGFIIIGFDEEKRSLHDRICDTRVVYKQ